MTGLMFRLENLRSNQLIEVEVSISLTYNAMVDGKFVRQFSPLELARNSIGLLTLSWAVVHPITEYSPLKTMDENFLKTNEAEFLVMLKAFDDNFSQTVHPRISYNDEEVVWNAKFNSAIFREESGVNLLDLQKIDNLNIL